MVSSAAEPSGLETAEIVLPMIVAAVQMYSDVAVIEVKPALFVYGVSRPLFLRL